MQCIISDEYLPTDVFAVKAEKRYGLAVYFHQKMTVDYPHQKTIVRQPLLIKPTWVYAPFVTYPSFPGVNISNRFAACYPQ